VDPEHRGRGYAKEFACALSEWALGNGHARVVLAHTKPENGASGAVLASCGFVNVGEVIDPEDGLVWQWRRERPATGGR
jgi:[ribosomal protein S5]-alanine N-acetyltransferase